MIPRLRCLDRLKDGLRRSPVVALVGPRQSGKTTLARMLGGEGMGGYFDLEDPVVALALEHPMSVLEGLEGLVIVDEVQRQPAIFPVLRVLVDRPGNRTRFLLLGSASPELTRQSSESLAGRVEIIELAGFGVDEVPEDEARKLWVRGGFPRSFLAEAEADSVAWRRNFTRTFLERDLMGMGFGMAPAAMGRFWTMLAHYHGQIWNGNEMAASLGVSPTTSRKYLDALEQTFMVRRLLPWYVNVGKRLVKTPKIYFRDSGLFHGLMGIQSESELLVHPKLGASWEGFALEQILRWREGEEGYFYSVHSGSELDLVFPTSGVGYEIKFGDAPTLTRSMRVALEDLSLGELVVVYPGRLAYRLAENVRVEPLAALARELGGARENHEPS